MPPNLFPKNPSFDSYVTVIHRASILRWVLNTLIVLASVTVGTIFVNVTAGYAFSFHKFKCQKILWSFLLLGIMIPRISLIIPLFVVINKIHLSGQLPAVILPCIFAPASMYLSKVYFDTVPRSLLESARIDGCSEWQVLKNIVLPVSLPIVTTIGLFSSVGSMQDWLWQALQLQMRENQTLLVGMTRSLWGSGLVQGMTKNYIGNSFATGVILILPVVILFAVASKKFVNGLGGAIKE